MDILNNTSNEYICTQISTLEPSENIYILARLEETKIKPV